MCVLGSRSSASALCVGASLGIAGHGQDALGGPGASKPSPARRGPRPGRQRERGPRWWRARAPSCRFGYGVFSLCAYCHGFCELLGDLRRVACRAASQLGVTWLIEHIYRAPHLARSLPAGVAILLVTSSLSVARSRFLILASVAGFRVPAAVSRRDAAASTQTSPDSALATTVLGACLGS